LPCFVRNPVNPVNPLKRFPKKSAAPIDKGFLMVYSQCCIMATTAKWAGNPHKTREPIRARERSRRLGPGARITFHVSRTCRPVLPRHSAAEAGARFSRFTFHVSPAFRNATAELHHSCTVSSPIFENAFHYSLSHSHLQNPIRKMVQFQVDIACRADLPRRSIRAKAGASERRREHPSGGGSIRAEAGASERRRERNEAGFTHHASRFTRTSPQNLTFSLPFPYQI
jgi:hypothetical protein